MAGSSPSQDRNLPVEPHKPPVSEHFPEARSAMSVGTKDKKKASKSAVKLQPLGDRVVVEREASEERTAGGIVLPDSAKNKPARGRVVSVGDGKILDDGKRGALQVKVGDRVLFS